MTNQPMNVMNDEEIAALGPKWHPLDVIGLIAGVVPFAFSISTTQTSFVETTPGGGMSIGTRTVKHIDYVAAAAAPIVLVCAVAGLAASLRRTPRARRWIRFVVFAGLVFLALV